MNIDRICQLRETLNDLSRTQVGSSSRGDFWREVRLLSDLWAAGKNREAQSFAISTVRDWESWIEKEERELLRGLRKEGRMYLRKDEARRACQDFLVKL